MNTQTQEITFADFMFSTYSPNIVKGATFQFSKVFVPETPVWIVSKKQNFPFKTKTLKSALESCYSIMQSGEWYGDLVVGYWFDEEEGLYCVDVSYLYALNVYTLNQVKEIGKSNEQKSIGLLLPDGHFYEIKL